MEKLNATRIAEWCFCAAAYHLGLGRWISPLDRRTGEAATIILYHRIYPDGEGPRGALHKSVFELQLKHLKSRYSVMHLKDMVDLVVAGRRLPPRAVAITIDDGYRDAYTQAFPAIQKTECPVTIFLTAGSIGTRQVFWWNQLVYAIFHTSRSRAEVDDIALAHGLPPVAWDGGPDIEEMLSAIKLRPEAEIQQLVSDIVAELKTDLAANAGDYMMSWSEARTMADSGLVTICAHSLTHQNLSMANLDDLRKEVYDSKAIIEAKLRRSVHLFAYPFGKATLDYTDQVKEIVREAGFAGALTVNPSMVEYGVNAYEIPRFPEESQRWRGLGGRFSPALFDAYMNGTRDYLSMLRAGLRLERRA